MQPLFLCLLTVTPLSISCIFSAPPPLPSPRDQITDLSDNGKHWLNVGPGLTGCVGLDGEGWGLSVNNGGDRPFLFRLFLVGAKRHRWGCLEREQNNALKSSAVHANAHLIHNDTKTPITPLLCLNLVCSLFTLPNPEFTSALTIISVSKCNIW